MGVVVTSGEGAILLVRATGGVPRTLTHGRQPDFSPQGSKLAFARGGDIYVVPVSGGKEELMVRNGAHPEWSPDGRYLAFTRTTACRKGGCQRRVFIMSASGGKPRVLGPDSSTSDLCRGVVEARRKPPTPGH